MADIIEISSVQFDLPAKLRHLRVAAYCRVSTEQEEQNSSIQLQEMCYRRMIEENPNWENAGIFSEKATGLNLYCREEFRAMLRSCRKGKIDLILTKSISRFGRNTLDMLKALRELHELGVDVYFEKENLWLHENKIPSPTGKERWSRDTISKLLRNEKYIGDVMLQKTFVENLFFGKQIKNIGQKDRYLIQEHHPAIVCRELFEKANSKYSQNISMI